MYQANISQAESRRTALNNIIDHNYETQGLHDPQKMEKVKACLLSLQEAFIRKKLPISATMNYGSAACGFGSVESDLDITVIVSPNYELKGEKAILKKIAEILLECDGNCEAKFINARVPIVTTRYKGFPIDICYDGVAAVEEGKLLKTYGNWDRRILVLGFFVKKWAKLFEICDGSLGFFKSYHWILLTIDFLQAALVVPCIQTKEFYPGHGTPPWRFYPAFVFMSTYEKLSTRNISTPSELFLQFLDYYAYLDFSKEVIFIGDMYKRPRTRYDLRDPVCIRSPFYCGSGAFKRLSKEEKKYYRKYYGSLHEQNIARCVTQDGLNKMQKLMMESAHQIRGYFQGNPITCPTMRKLFGFP